METPGAARDLDGGDRGLGRASSLAPPPTRFSLMELETETIPRKRKGAPNSALATEPDLEDREPKAKIAELNLEALASREELKAASQEPEKKGGPTKPPNMSVLECLDSMGQKLLFLTRDIEELSSSRN